MECTHYRNLAPCRICGEGLETDIRQLLWDLRKYIHEPNIEGIFRLPAELDARLIAVTDAIVNEDTELLP